LRRVRQAIGITFWPKKLRENAQLGIDYWTANLLERCDHLAYVPMRRAIMPMIIPASECDIPYSNRTFRNTNGAAHDAVC